MLKRISAALFGVVLLSTPALAVTGFLPQDGFGTVDGTYVKGIAKGLNFFFQSGIAAAGTTQATATQIPANRYLIEVDTVASGSGVALPPCLSGTSLSVYNNSANALLVYPAVANNPKTGAQDTINNTTSVSVAAHTPEILSCALNGVWSAK
jgi:hypothetical protein